LARKVNISRTDKIVLDTRSLGVVTNLGIPSHTRICGAG